MPDEPFIMLPRRFFNHDMWLEERVFSYFEAWLDMIRMAAWKDMKHLVKCNLIPVPRGSFFSAERFLAKRWRWSKQKVRNFMSLLEAESMISTQKNRQGTMITLLNYERYNSPGTTERPQKDHRKTTERPNNKKVKESKEVTPNEPPGFAEPPVSLEQAKSYAPQAGVTPDVAEKWWYARDRKNWEGVRKWRSDLKSFSLTHHEITASRTKAHHGSNPKKHSGRTAGTANEGNASEFGKLG